MQRLLAISALIIIILPVTGQDSVYIKRKLSETVIDILFSYYSQDGNNSAVTGGTGTEKLSVYAPKATFTYQMDSSHSVYFNGGVDIITSASTDRIDYRMSSASYKDFHLHIEGGYGYYIKKKRTEIGLGSHFSLESDYLSTGVNLWLLYTDRADMTSYSFTFQYFYDDMRWGRRAGETLTLVYPVELRDTNWFDIYLRYSYNLGLSFERVINRRMVLGLFPGLVFQTGLLSTPFHRVYFQGQEKAKVENFPRKRLKVPVGIKLNTYLGTSLALNSYYRFYWDDFDILANTFELAAYYKVNAYWTPSLSMRFYHQRGASWFKPYKEHLLSDRYYTSDYDLSGFYSLQAGAGLRFAPFKGISKNWSFNEIDLKYSYYWRSDGLDAHFISTIFGFGGEKNQAISSGD
jgi:hypothetical protein